MADDTTATIIQLHQPKAMTGAERSAAYRARKAARFQQPEVKSALTVETVPVPREEIKAPIPVTDLSVTSRPVTSRPSRSIAAVTLHVAAFGLAAVGVTMNGWFARSLGSSDVAGWLFLAVGVAADLAALALPASAAQQWQARHRATAMAAWAIWLATFAFAVTAGIGFASINISDVTANRASRVTPAVTASRAALADAMAARDRECTNGVGKVCREREAVVNDRRVSLDGAMAVVGKSSDPQTDAAIHIVAWLTLGTIKPTGDDFAMLRLVLLALLPQVGGLLLMVGRK